MSIVESAGNKMQFSVSDSYKTLHIIQVTSNFRENKQKSSDNNKNNYQRMNKIDWTREQVKKISFDYIRWA